MNLPGLSSWGGHWLTALLFPASECYLAATCRRTKVTYCWQLLKRRVYWDWLRLVGTDRPPVLTQTPSLHFTPPGTHFSYQEWVWKDLRFLRTARLAIHQIPYYAKTWWWPLVTSSGLTWQVNWMPRRGTQFPWHRLCHLTWDQANQKQGLCQRIAKVFTRKVQGSSCILADCQRLSLQNLQWEKNRRRRWHLQGMHQKSNANCVV